MLLHELLCWDQFRVDILQGLVQVADQVVADNLSFQF